MTDCLCHAKHWQDHRKFNLVILGVFSGLLWTDPLKVVKGCAWVITDCSIKSGEGVFSGLLWTVPL